MTDLHSDNDNKPRAAAVATSSSLPASSAIVAPGRPPKSGRGLAGLALLFALGAGGASGYLWYLWQQDQARQANRLDQTLKQAMAPRDTELQVLKTQIQQLQTLKAEFDQARAANQTVKEQLLGLTGDLQPLKNAMELQKGENSVLKGEMKLLRENQDVQKTGTQEQQRELDGRFQTQQTQLAKLDEQYRNLQLAHDGLADSFDTLKTVAAKGGDVNAFPLAEVDYLLRLADNKLKLERNLPAARLALDTAQQRLNGVKENALASVQTLLAEMIGSLRGVQLPDLSALAHKVVEMEKRVATLPVKIDSGVSDIKNRIKPADQVAVSADPARPWWERAGEAVWKHFRDIVVIRRVRSDAPPLIAMEEEFFLRQNLILELESMRVALLRGDAQSYQDSHELVENWLKTYFDPQDARVAAFVDEVKALRAVSFNAYIPDLTGLNQAFQDAMARRQPLRALQPAATKETHE